MTAFAYFITALTSCPDQDLPTRGLGHLEPGYTRLPGHHPHRAEPGLFLLPTTAKPDPAGFTWRPFTDFTADPADQHLHIGIPNPLPTPTQLLRRRIIHGDETPLGPPENRHPWLIPIALEHTNGPAPASTLPGPVILDRGRWTKQLPNPNHRRLADLAWELLTQAHHPDGATIRWVDIIFILSINYQLSAVEASILQLLDPTDFLPLARILTDIQGAIDVKKNNAPTGESTNGPAAPPAPPQPSAPSTPTPNSSNTNTNKTGAASSTPS